MTHGLATMKRKTHFTQPDMPWKKEVVCVIPARGGSKGLPNKNLIPLQGKPLLAHTIDHALNSRLISYVYVSSDDNEILSVAHKYGAIPIQRPPDLSGDFAPSEWAVMHALKERSHVTDSMGAMLWGIDAIVLLQCTSPIRTSADIDKAIRMVTMDGYDSVLSVVPMAQFVWEDDERGAWPLNYIPTAQRPMRQQVKQYIENGAIYVARPQIYERGTRLGGKIGLYVMDHWARHEIDTAEDLELVTWIMEHVRS